MIRPEFDCKLCDKTFLSFIYHILQWCKWIDGVGWICNVSAIYIFNESNKSIKLEFNKNDQFIFQHGKALKISESDSKELGEIPNKF